MPASTPSPSRTASSSRANACATWRRWRGICRFHEKRFRGGRTTVDRPKAWHVRRAEHGTFAGRNSAVPTTKRSNSFSRDFPGHTLPVVEAEAAPAGFAEGALLRRDGDIARMTGHALQPGANGRVVGQIKAGLLGQRDKQIQRHIGDKTNIAHQVRRAL